MNRSHRSLTFCLGVLCLGTLIAGTPVQPEANTPEEIAAGTASLRRSTDRLAAMLQKLPDRFSRQVQETAVQDLAQYGGRVMGDYDAIGAPLEVVVTQSVLLAADKLMAENNQDLTNMVQQRIQATFGTTVEDQEKLHAQKIAWSEVILALAVARAAEKDVNDLVAQAKAGKAWTDIAEGAGLKKGKMGEVLRELWKQ